MQTAVMHTAVDTMKTMYDKNIPQWICRFFCVVSSIFFFSGCAQIDRFVESTQPYYTSDYKECFKAWSREAQIHEGLKVKLIAAATYKSDVFLQAYIEEYAAAYRLNEEQKKTFVEGLLRENRDKHSFMLATFVPDKKWDQFDKAPSMWKLYLVNDQGERVSPLDIEKIELKKDAFTPHFFPYVTPWKTVYTVTFPLDAEKTETPMITDTTTSVTLLITGLEGTTEMVWNLEKK